jgi:hypothetical protein
MENWILIGGFVVIVILSLLEGKICRKYWNRLKHGK